MHRRAPTTTGPSPLPTYLNSLQSDGLKLVPKEIQSSPAVEGELPEDGLAAYGDDLMLAPARKIMSGAEEDDAETQQSQFSRAGVSDGRARGGAGSRLGYMTCSPIIIYLTC